MFCKSCGVAGGVVAYGHGRELICWPCRRMLTAAWEPSTKTLLEALLKQSALSTGPASHSGEYLGYCSAPWNVGSYGPYR